MMVNLSVHTNLLGNTDLKRFLLDQPVLTANSSIPPRKTCLMASATLAFGTLDFVYVYCSCWRVWLVRWGRRPF